MFNFIVIPISLVICLILQPIYFQKIVTIGRRSHRRGNYRHKKALAGRAYLVRAEIMCGIAGSNWEKITAPTTHKIILFADVDTSAFVA